MATHTQLILGLNAYHPDSAACLVRNGVVIAAVEEERLRRIKHWAGLPTEAIRWCLTDAGATLADIDHIAVNRKPGVHNLRRAWFTFTHRPHWRLILSKIRMMRTTACLETALRRSFPGQELRASIHHVEHHLAHLASAFLASPFKDAVCLSVDGFGDFASVAWAVGCAGQIRVVRKIFFPHSLGLFYSALTQFIGFPQYGDEYKVMGLAPYGQPRFVDSLRQVLHVRSDGTFRLNLDYFVHHRDHRSYHWDRSTPQIGVLYSPRLPELLGAPRESDQPLDQRHLDLAASTQAVYENAFFNLLNAIHSSYPCPNLALAGGCALNSVANGKVSLHSPFRNLFVPPAPGDPGGAIGAALIIWQKTRHSQPDRSRPPNLFTRSDHNSPVENLSSSLSAQFIPQDAGCLPLTHAYLGGSFSDEYIAFLLQDRLNLHKGERSVEARKAHQELTAVATPYLSIDRLPAADGSKTCGPVTVTHFESSAELARHTAAAIAHGKVVGWFQGRMEWGPRALGNRSILADPRRADMRDMINGKIKRRESFRPFAPSILRENVSEWFDQDADVPFMSQVFQVKFDKRAQIPAVCHLDGSARLQTVHRDTNPLFYQLIAEFFALTSVPMLLNTSFNENEPVVCKPEEALDCFLRTQMDVLVLGNYLANRQ